VDPVKNSKNTAYASLVAFLKLESTLKTSVFRPDSNFLSFENALEKTKF
jgi:hypothetical protein